MLRNLPLVFKIVSVLVPISLIIGPPRVLQLSPRYIPVRPCLLWVAGVLFFISWYLPSPLIQGKDTAFLTHFLGGGIFAGLLGWYVAKSLQLKMVWWQELVAIFFLVSGLGVANELFELLTVQAGLSHIDPLDTWWDLLANTLGALLLVPLWQGLRILKK